MKLQCGKKILINFSGLIFRWRKLSGDDPSTFELIQKIHSLQKRLIQRKEDLVHRDLALQERDKVYKRPRRQF